jgi:hypothetical protein
VEKKATANKPKPKPIKIDDFDEDLDGKYYIKTNWINQLKNSSLGCFFLIPSFKTCLVPVTSI